MLSLLSAVVTTTNNNHSAWVAFACVANGVLPSHFNTNMRPHASLIKSG